MKLQTLASSIVGISILIIFTLSSCKKTKEELPTPDANGYIWLRDIKSKSLIQKTITGKWQIHYAYGGVTGRQKVLMSNSSFTFGEQDHLEIVLEGSVYTSGTTNLVNKKSEFGTTPWILEFQTKGNWNMRDELVIDMIKNDSLWVVQNNPDPLSYVMTKIK